MTDYYTVLDRQFEATGTIVIRGLALEVGAQHPLRAKGYFPVMSPTCVCVTEPCPCDHDDDVIVWLPSSGVRSRAPSTHKSKSGEALEEFHVMREADVVTEVLTRRKAASFDPRSKARGPLGSRLGAPFRGASPLRMSTECAGNTLYLVVEGADGSGGTLFEYIPIGSCTTSSS